MMCSYYKSYDIKDSFYNLNSLFNTTNCKMDTKNYIFFITNL